MFRFAQHDKARRTDFLGVALGLNADAMKARRAINQQVGKLTNGMLTAEFSSVRCTNTVGNSATLAGTAPSFSAGIFSGTRDRTACPNHVHG
jgi:hypothetical protein